MRTYLKNKLKAKELRAWLNESSAKHEALSSVPITILENYNK
jgi:arsenate reductase-like glutaredoxin family protein